MARVRFLAPTADPRPGQEGMVYGAATRLTSGRGHRLRQEPWHDGKVEILDSPG